MDELYPDIMHTNSLFIPLRKEYMDFCDGNMCAALLLAYFELQYLRQRSHYLEFLLNQEVTGDTSEYPVSRFYVTRSQDFLVKRLMGSYQKKAVAEALKLLEDKEAIQIIPWPVYIKSKPTRYLFNPDVINQFTKLNYVVARKDAKEFIAPSKNENTDSRSSSDRDSAGTLVARKDATKEEIKDKDLKDTLSKDKEGSSDEKARPKLLRKNPTDHQTIKPTLLRRKSSLFPSKDLETLFKHWNNLGVLLPKHREDPNTKLFKQFCKKGTSILRKHSVDEVIRSMNNYYSLVSGKTKLHTKAIGHVVNLINFFEFSTFITDTLLDNIKNGRSDDVVDDIDSWFEECLQDKETLLEKYALQEKMLEDKHPNVSKELARLYREKINNRTFTNKEINMFIKAADKLVTYHENMKGKLNFSSAPIEKDSYKAFAHHMIDCILDNTADISIVQVSWLLTDKHFDIRMTNHFKKIGMLSKEHRSSAADLATEDDKAKKSNEYSAVRNWIAAEKERIQNGSFSDEKRKELQNELSVTAAAKFKRLDDKYSNTTNVEVEKTASITDLLYDDE